MPIMLKLCQHYMLNAFAYLLYQNLCQHNRLKPKLNHQAALHNISILCPSFSTILKNTYGVPIRLFITGEGEISSTEGTTQGDPLAMGMYAVAITPLIHQLRQSKPDMLQVWFADDATAAGSLDSLLKWWIHLQSIGTLYGYYPSAPKTHLIVKPELFESASSIFEGTSIQITSQVSVT